MLGVGEAQGHAPGPGPGLQPLGPGALGWKTRGPWALGPGALYMKLLWGLFIPIYPYFIPNSILTYLVTQQNAPGPHDSCWGQ